MKQQKTASDTNCVFQATCGSGFLIIADTGTFPDACDCKRQQRPPHAAPIFV